MRAPVLSLFLVLPLVLAPACGGEDDNPGTYIGNRGEDTGAADVPSEPDLVAAEVEAEDVQADQVPAPDGETLEETANWQEWAKNYGEGCALDERVGRFTVAHLPLEGFVVGGLVNDSLHVQDLRVPGLAEGDCVMLDKVNPFCDPGCSGDEQCLPDGSCAPYPTALSAGTVTVTGMNEPVTMEPNPSDMYSAWGFAPPLFEAGQEVELTAAGDAVDGFGLQGHGVALLADVEMPEDLVHDSPMEVTWTPSTGPGEIHLLVSIGNHAESPSSISCVVADTGSLSVPTALVNELLLDFVAGTITADLYRRTIDSVDLEGGCVELELFSDVTKEMHVQ